MVSGPPLIGAFVYTITGRDTCDLGRVAKVLDDLGGGKWSVRLVDETEVVVQYEAKWSSFLVQKP